MRINKNDIKRFSPEIQAQLRAHLAVPHAKLESIVRCQQVEEKKDTRFNTCVDIVFHSKRRRLIDADNISGKAALDSLVTGGILQGDESKHVRSVTHTQEKSEVEETIITITEI
jgi:hypothetical protein